MTKKIYLYMLLGSIAISTPTISFADSMSAYEAAKEIAYAKIMNKALQKINQTQKDIEREILKTATAKNAQGYQINLTDNYVKYTLNSFLPTNYDKNYLNLVSSSTSLPPLAYDITQTKDKIVTFKIPFSTQVIDFLKEVDELKSKNTISTTKPTDTTKLWYKPDGNGGFLVYKYNQSQKKWELILAKAVKSKLNQTNTTIVKSKEELDNLVANKGDIAYINKDDNSIQKYIYDGSSWILQSEATNYKKVTECSADDIGVIKYISQNDCLSSCQKDSQNKYSWECIESKDDTTPCKTIYNSCYAIKKANPNAKDGVYTIDPDGKGGNEPFKAYCDMTTDGGGWTVFQNRESKSDFYRGWNDYKNGFGDLNSNFWLGNEKIHLLTKTPKELYIKMTRETGEIRYAKYSSFIIANESQKYKLYVSGYSGTAGDSFSGHNGMYFSTKDMDNDAYNNGNCAEYYKGGWWYSACHDSNLNGYYYGGPHSSYADGLEWRYWTGYHNSLIKTRMMIRGGTPSSYKKCENPTSKPKIYKSCKEIKQANPNAKDGVYTIDPDGEGGNAPFKVYCDMTTDGGGWTLVGHFSVNGGTISEGFVLPTEHTNKVYKKTMNILFNTIRLKTNAYTNDYVFTNQRTTKELIDSKAPSDGGSERLDFHLGIKSKNAGRDACSTNEFSRNIGNNTYFLLDEYYNCGHRAGIYGSYNLGYFNKNIWSFTNEVGYYVNTLDIYIK